MKEFRLRMEDLPYSMSKNSNLHYSYWDSLIDAHVDPKHRDIVLNGFGIKRSQAKKLGDWLTKALKECK